jgi:hypothetical protein
MNYYGWDARIVLEENVFQKMLKAQDRVAEESWRCLPLWTRLFTNKKKWKSEFIKNNYSKEMITIPRFGDTP